MIWLSIILVAFAAGMVFWNRTMRTYSSQCIAWLEDVAESLSTNSEWELDVSSIKHVSVPIAVELQEWAAFRFIPYTITFGCCLIMMVLAGLNIPSVLIIDYIVGAGVAYMAISGLSSRQQFLKTQAEIKAVTVVLQSKMIYDKQIANDIQETPDEDE